MLIAVRLLVSEQGIWNYRERVITGIDTFFMDFCGKSRTRIVRCVATTLQQDPKQNERSVSIFRHPNCSEVLLPDEMNVNHARSISSPRSVHVPLNQKEIKFRWPSTAFATFRSSRISTTGNRPWPTNCCWKPIPSKRAK